MVDEVLSHIDDNGKARMVDVTDKDITKRIARAYGEIKMKSSTLELVFTNSMKKGDVLAVARIAGIMAAKNTHLLIPLCHPLLLTSIKIDFKINKDDSKIEIYSEVALSGKTGVEMEALQAVSTAALTIFDMCKAVEHTMEIGSIVVITKEGGKSGVWKNENKI
ncbi:MAG: cyclic pyranopterin monophosphate synthase MoaC [Spirochaetaceae bacterium]|nr:cyclic pyranopterin monophosphate synthase MoaC [Spirochaetaceae bacterium]